MCLASCTLSLTEQLSWIRDKLTGWLSRICDKQKSILKKEEKSNLQSNLGHTDARPTLYYRLASGYRLYQNVVMMISLYLLKIL